MGCNSSVERSPSELHHSLSTRKEEVGAGESKTPIEKIWIGDWSYIIKNEVHNFKIRKHRGNLVYVEEMGHMTMTGTVKAQEETARITSQKMNFEIDLNRKKKIAKYRNLGSSKWTKDIQLLKLGEEFDDGDDGTGESAWSRSTLRNTFRNKSESSRSSSESIKKSKSSFVKHDSKSKSRSIRWADSGDSGVNNITITPAFGDYASSPC